MITFKNKLITVLTIIFFAIHGNSLFAKEDITLYYRNLYEAEKSICKQQFRKALFSYQKAFFFKKHPFAKDLYNACLCAIKLNRFRIANFFLIEIAKKGIPITIFDKKIIDILPSNKIVLNRYNTAYSRKIKNTLKDTLLVWIAEQDQKVRNGEYTNKEIEEVDYKNDSLFYNYVQINGFPSEEDYAVGDRIDCLPSFTLVIWHQTKGKHYHDYNEVLLNAIYKGSISAEIGSALTETHSGLSFGTKTFYYLQCNSCNDDIKEKILGKLYYPKDIQINKNKKMRDQYLLDSFENIHFKNRFKSKNEEFRFGCFASIFPTFNYSKEEYLLSMLDNSQEYKTK